MLIILFLSRLIVLLKKTFTKVQRINCDVQRKKNKNKHSCNLCLRIICLNNLISLNVFHLFAESSDEQIHTLCAID